MRSIQRGLLFAVLVVGPLIVLPNSTDVYAVAKASVVWLAALSCLLVQAAWVGRHREVRPMGWPLTATLAAFLLALAIAVASASYLPVALAGWPTRFTGLLTYAAAVILFWTALQAVELHHVRRLLLAHGLTGVVVAALVLIERAQGAHLFGVGAVLRQPVGTMGNPNFAAGYLAVAAVALLGIAVTAKSRRIRLLLMLGLLVQLAAVSATGSLQGFAGFGAGVAAAAIMLSAGLGWRRRRMVRGAIGAGVLVVLALAIPGLMGRGPVGWIADDAGVRARLIYWRVGAEMLRQQPWTGVGFGGYPTRFEALLRPEEGAFLDREPTPDDPHNVPLALALDAGAFGGLAYLAFVGMVAAAAWRGSRRLPAAELALLATAVGSWAAYQAQAMMSIDRPPLPALHFVLAGLVVVLAQPAPLRHVRGSVSLPARPIAVTAAVLGGVLAVVPLVWPLRSEMAISRILMPLLDGDETGLARVPEVVGSGYSVRRQQWLLFAAAQDTERWELALSAADGLMAAEPWSAWHAYQAGAVAYHLGDLDQALVLLRRAVGLGPARPFIRDDLALVVEEQAALLTTASAP